MWKTARMDICVNIRSRGTETLENMVLKSLHVDLCTKVLRKNYSVVSCFLYYMNRYKNVGNKVKHYLYLGYQKTGQTSNFGFNPITGEN